MKPSCSSVLNFVCLDYTWSTFVCACASLQVIEAYTLSLVFSPRNATLVIQPSSHGQGSSCHVLLQVIYAYILGTAFFHEKATLLGILGAVLIAVGVVTVNADKKSGPAAAAKADEGDKTNAGREGKDGKDSGPRSINDGIGSGGSSCGFLGIATGVGAGGGEHRHGVEDGAEVGAGGRQQHRDRHGRLKLSSSFQREAGPGAHQRHGAEEKRDAEEGGSSPRRRGVGGSSSQGHWQGPSMEPGPLIPAGRQDGSLELHHVGRSQRQE